MSRLLLVFVLLTVTASASAQTTAENPYEDKEWALLFSLDDFTLRSFDGGSLTAKLHRTPITAWRASIGFGGALSFRSGDNAGERRFFSEGEEPAQAPFSQQNESDTDEDMSHFFISTSAQYVRYFPTERTLTFYTAIGPDVFVAYQQREDEIDSRTDRQDRTEWTQFRETENTSTQIGAGLLGSIGLEWFVTSSVSLVAEYNLSGGYFYSRDRSTQEQESRQFRDTDRTDVETGTDTQTMDTHGARLNQPFPRFGVSLYF